MKQVLKNVIKRAFGELNNIFQDELKKKNYHNSQQMLDFFYHITESNKLNWKKKKVQNMLILPCRWAMF